MGAEIFEAFPDRETFDKYWAESYVPVTYEDVQTAFEEYVNSVDGHIFDSDYETNGRITKADFKEHLSSDARFMFEDILTEVFYDKNAMIYETAFAIYEEAQEAGTKDAGIAQIFHDTFRKLQEEFLDRLFDKI